jgi:hypothetical protein
MGSEALALAGDPLDQSVRRVWQDELSASGWTDGRLQGLGSHDDCVTASWFLELAIRHVRELLDLRPGVELVPLEELGIEQVTISADY